MRYITILALLTALAVGFVAPTAAQDATTIRVISWNVKMVACPQVRYCATGTAFRYMASPPFSRYAPVADFR